MFKKRLASGGLATSEKKDVQTPLSLTVGVWLCCLPIILLLVIPFFGWKVGAIGALVLFGILLVVCFGICTTKAYKKGGENHA